MASTAVQLQRRRGSATQTATFVGAPAELTVNTDTDRLHVHDGETQGGFPAAQLSEVGLLKAVRRSVNLNVTGDNLLTLALPPGVANYRVDRIVVSNSAGVVPSNAKIGVYTGAGETGVAIASQQVLSGITSQAPNISPNSLSLTLNNNSTTYFTAATLYVNVGTAQGAAANVDVIVFLNTL